MFNKSTVLGDFSVSAYKGGECFAILDTETNGLPPHGVVYDIGFTLLEQQCGELVVVGKHGVLIEEIFTNPKVMRNAYFANKVMSHYPYLLQAGEERLQPWELAIAEIRFIFERYKVRKVGAYNANFDLRMLGNTAQHLEQLDFFAAYQWFDLWQIACNTLLQTPDFKHWAAKRGLFSEKGNIMTSAEVCYRYIKGCDFVEDHTALSDSVLESEIAQEIFKKYGGALFSSASMSGRTWQAVNDYAAKEAVRKAQALGIVSVASDSRY